MKRHFTLVIMPIHPDTWKRYDREPVRFNGVDCCVYVEEVGEGEVSVELIPEDQEEGDGWPVDVLKLSHARQRELMKKLCERV
jgi:hypothetical protein